MAKKQKPEAERLEQEKRELNSLINKGYTFEVEDTEFRIEKRFFGLLKKRVPVKVKRQFRIKEPTLGTLDRLSAEWVEIAIDEEKLKGSDGLKVAKSLANRHAKRCARIVALSVLGSDYLIPKYAGNAVRYTEDDVRLNELTDLFTRTIKPSRLYELTLLINTISNFGDFLNSIRLMQSERTTAPDLVE